MRNSPTRIPYNKPDREATELSHSVHVDDRSIATSRACLADALNAGTRLHIKVTDLEKLHWMLGIEVYRNLKPCQPP